MTNMVTKIDLRTNDTRKRIIKEAQHLYQMGGYNQLSMDKIAEVLGLKRPTLYYHFPGGKEQLLVETLNILTDELITAWENAIRTGRDTRNRLRNILGSAPYYSMTENKRTFLYELWQLSEEVKTAVKQSYEKVFDLLAQVFKEGMEKGEIREVELEIAMHSFFAIFDQVENMVTVRELFPELGHNANTFELEVLIDKIFNLWMTGLLVPVSPSS